ncbi:hypothetical protein FBULB1_591 [Fusarium bulbicola]|nr:hypothetical protein FBULB1_591 [Fusarium bulbicola]
MARVVGVHDTIEFPGEYWWQYQMSEDTANELMYQVIEEFRKTLVEADKTLVGIATDENGEAVPRHMGVGKLHEVLAHLGTFLETQRNAGIVFMMILEIVRLQQVVEDKGEGKWLQPLKETLGDALYEQIAQAGVI